MPDGVMDSARGRGRGVLRDGSISFDCIQAGCGKLIVTYRLRLLMCKQHYVGYNLRIIVTTFECVLLPCDNCSVNERGLGFMNKSTPQQVVHHRVDTE